MPSRDTQFKAGESGNPKGRPPKPETIRKLLQEITSAETNPDGPVSITKLEAMLHRVVEIAQTGKPWAVHFVCDRLEGKPIPMAPEPVEQEPLKIIFEEVRCPPREPLDG
jgi:hypothetical protein